MSESTTLGFSTKDILNSELVDPSGIVRYKTITPDTLNMNLRRKPTTICRGDSDDAVVDWRKRTLVLEGTGPKPWDGLKIRIGWPFSSKYRDWCWKNKRYTILYARNRDGKMHYTVRYARADGAWNNSVNANSTDLTHFSPHVSHLFRSDDKAIISRADGLSDTEKLFLLSVLIISETRRHDVGRADRNISADGEAA
ncbi:hypothetical protein C8F01DRAFT_1142448 [Mycena amicta]|nr:hypothetical protein C8F01DRAFT_1142448 [Mycena amicta]